MRNSPSIESQKGFIDFSSIPAAIYSIWRDVRLGISYAMEDSKGKRWHKKNGEDIGVKLLEGKTINVATDFPMESSIVSIHPEFFYAPSFIMIRILAPNVPVDTKYLKIAEVPLIPVSLDLNRSYGVIFLYRQWLQDNITDPILRDRFGLDK